MPFIECVWILCEEFTLVFSSLQSDSIFIIAVRIVRIFYLLQKAGVDWYVFDWNEIIRCLWRLLNWMIAILSLIGSTYFWQLPLCSWLFLFRITVLLLRQIHPYQFIWIQFKVIGCPFLVLSCFLVKSTLENNLIFVGFISFV